MERRAITSSMGWLITYGLVMVGKGPRQRKEYRLTAESMKEPGKPHRGYMTPTVVLKGTVASRARLIDHQTVGRITEKTKFTRCPSSPVYSNVQLLPDEKVPAIFSALGPGRYLEET